MVQSKSSRSAAASHSEIESLRRQYNEVTQSSSYKIGRLITLPVRIARKIKAILGKRYVMLKNMARVRRVIWEQYGLRIASKLERPSISLVVRSIEHPTSSTFIRMISPISVLCRENEQLSVELVDGDHPRVSPSAKIVVVQRTALINMTVARKVLKRIKNNEARLIVDTDDAFDSLDANHPQYGLQRDRIEALDYTLNNADAVWVSTEKLQKVYGHLGAKVIENTLDTAVWTKLVKEVVDIPLATSPLEIVYMGTKTHDGDFEIILPALKDLYRKYPGAFQLHIIGVASQKDTPPWLVVHHPPDGLYPNFVRWFNGLGPFDIGVSPLEDTPFNKNKSDIKCLDYLAIGAKPVVSDTEAYKNPELDEYIVRVGDAKLGWFDALEREVTNREANRRKAEQRILAGYQYVKQRRNPEWAAKSMQNSEEAFS